MPSRAEIFRLPCPRSIIASFWPIRCWAVEVELQVNSSRCFAMTGRTPNALCGASGICGVLTGLGQVVTLTALVRGDIYNTDNILCHHALPAIAAPKAGPRAPSPPPRSIIEWPFAGEAFGGTQVLKPRVQLVASPKLTKSRRAQRGCPFDRS